jgi:hypothetical protein
VERLVAAADPNPSLHVVVATFRHRQFLGGADLAISQRGRVSSS